MTIASHRSLIRLSTLFVLACALALAASAEAQGFRAVFSRDGTDVSDPIGGGWDEYAACAASIEKQLAPILDEIL